MIDRYVAGRMSHTKSKCMRSICIGIGTDMRESKDVVIISYWLLPLLLLLTASAGASTQATLTQVVNPAPTTTLLEEPPGSLFISNEFPLLIQVTSTKGLVVTAGSVTLTDNSNVIGSTSVDNGRATFTQNIPSTGRHLLVACYAGLPNFLPSCTAPLNISTLAPYTLKQTNPSGTIDAPKAFVDDLQVIPAKGFSGVVRLTCQVSSYSCNLSTSSISFSGDGRSQIVRASFSPDATSTQAGLLGLPILGAFGIIFGSRNGRSRKIRSLLCCTALIGCVGCGPIISVPISSAAQTMLVTSASGSYSQDVTYQIQVVSNISQ
jgi:hypothetical protein